ncbi:hypothetical protein MK079_02810 [Candidatus Gracilibacteria bacterium]|nr:hypothetical protein [Candidatus Gracilibacteria bacterium]
MKLKILSLNCQKNHQSGLGNFLTSLLIHETYDIFLLQEASGEVLNIFSSFGKYIPITYFDAKGKLCLTNIVYNSKKLQLKEKYYEPILVDIFSLHEELSGVQSYGINMGIFEYNKKQLNISSVHLPSGFRSRYRYSGFLKILQKIKKHTKQICFFGGDMNIVYRWESKKILSFSGDNYSCTTQGLGYTLDSYYTENHLDFLWVKMNNFFRRFGLSKKFKTDHIFIDTSSHNRYHISTRILPDRVSDHSPIEVILDI